MGKVSHSGNARHPKVIVFFDDLLIHSPDLQTHMRNIKQVFMLLRRAVLRLNMESYCIILEMTAVIIVFTKE